MTAQSKDYLLLDWTAEEAMKIIVGQDQLQQWGWNLAQQLPSTFPTRKSPWMFELLLSVFTFMNQFSIYVDLLSERQLPRRGKEYR